MSDLEFVGKMNPQPFISLAREEQMRIEAIKKRLLNEKSNSKSVKKSDTELTYERDISNDCE